MSYLFRKSLLILLLSSLFLGCGYSLSKRPSYFKAEWKTVYIPPWKNFSSETGLGYLIAEKLRLKLAEGNLLVPVYNKKEADLILKGKVIKVCISPSVYATITETKERKVSFWGEFELIEKKTGKIIFKKKIQRFETYRVPSTSSIIVDPGKEEAVRLLTDDIADMVLEAIIFK